MTAPGTRDPRAELIRVLQDKVWPFLAHDPYNPDVFWGGMADAVMTSGWLVVHDTETRRAAWREGWVPFGTHAPYHGIPAIFSEERSEDGLPMWERLPRTDAEAAALRAGSVTE